MALLGKLANHPFGIRPLGDAFDIGRLHLSTEVRLNNLAAAVMRMRPAIIPDRTDIDEADLQGFRGPGRHDPLRCDQASRCSSLQKAAPIHIEQHLSISSCCSWALLDLRLRLAD